MYKDGSGKPDFGLLIKYLEADIPERELQNKLRIEFKENDEEKDNENNK